MEKISRKDFVKKSLCACAGLAAVSVLQGCGLLDEPEMKVGTLDEIRAAGYKIASFNGDDIFAIEQEGEWRIYSLICTHKKCTVEFKPELQQFHCPCHDGIYSIKGKVLDGPPPAALRRFQLEVRGNELWVKNEKLAGQVG